MRGIFVVLVLGLVGCAVSPDAGPSPTGPFSRLIVFGDSVSDTGNLIVQTLGSVPGPPNYMGRFNNGPLWIDTLAQYLGLEVQPSLSGGTNFAHSAAATGEGLAKWNQLPIGPNLLEQIKLYRGQPDGTELFAIWCGAADLAHTLRGECAATADQMADHIGTAITRLYDRGGRFFLVVNLPDFGLFPEYKTMEERSAASSFVAAVNTAVAARLDQIDPRDGITVYRLDSAAALTNLLSNPPEGLTNISDPAWSGDFAGYSAGGVLVDNPDAYLYWDSFHPGRVWHDRVAAQAMRLLEDRPPPARITGAPITAFQPLGLPQPIDYWLSFFTLATQPGASTGECRY